MDYTQIKEFIDQHTHIVILQADNPDADSLASSLALEQILHALGKEPYMYCGIDMPEYLRYMPGWDRVNKELPSTFDISVVVDTSTISLFERLQDAGMQGWIAARPCIILDHHGTSADDIPFASITINDPTKVSTGELIYAIARDLDWPLDDVSGGFIMTSILADSMGLSTEATTPETYRVMAELLELGVNRTELEEKRREYNKMEPTIFRYKAQLIERTEIIDDAVAVTTVPQDEINMYSPLFNPAPLIQPEHLQTRGIKLSLVLKSYDSGRVTGAIRCNYGSPIAARLAEKFGGGGHDYAAGFKVESADLQHIKQQSVAYALELLGVITS